MKLHNTLSKATEEFVPIGSPVKMYSCGPTVYAPAHIGNLSSYIYADLLRRILASAGYEVKHVMNLTDVDDKTIRDSLTQFPDVEPMEALKKLTARHEQGFMDDMAAVGNDVGAVEFVRATDAMADIQELITKLLETSMAYKADDGIYFDIAKYRESRKYGQLSKIELPERVQARINNDEYDKESAQDFALWKATKPDEPSWGFPGQMPGRPGWHIECSAMSVKALGQPFDIHTGGIDLIFPHHENEIAQSTADGQPEKLANYFVHNGHMLVDSKKMAKSANNFYTLADIEQKGFSPLDFRMLVLQSHYQSSSNFTWENLESAHNRLKNWKNVAELRHQLSSGAANSPQGATVASLLSQALEALQNNLDTPGVLVYLDKAFDIASATESSGLIETLIKFIDDNLGLELADTTPDITDDIKEMIQLRATARAGGDYAKSDEIRDALLEQGVELNDAPNGTIWNRK